MLGSLCDSYWVFCTPVRYFLRLLEGILRDSGIRTGSVDILCRTCADGPLGIQCWLKRQEDRVYLENPICRGNPKIVGVYNTKNKQLIVQTSREHVGAREDTALSSISCDDDDRFNRFSVQEGECLLNRSKTEGRDSPTSISH